MKKLILALFSLTLIAGHHALEIKFSELDLSPRVQTHRGRSKLGSYRLYKSLPFDIYNRTIRGLSRTQARIFKTIQDISVERFDTDDCFWVILWVRFIEGIKVYGYKGSATAGDLTLLSKEEYREFYNNDDLWPIALGVNLTSDVLHPCIEYLTMRNDIVVWTTYRMRQHATNAVCNMPSTNERRRFFFDTVFYTGVDEYGMRYTRTFKGEFDTVLLVRHRDDAYIWLQDTDMSITRYMKKADTRGDWIPDEDGEQEQRVQELFGLADKSDKGPETTV